MKPFNGDALARSLVILSREAQLAFGLSCCERLYPNYIAFSRQSGWGQPETLRRALDLAWSVLDGASPSRDSLIQTREEVQAAEPDTEDFDTILVSSALDAASSAGLLLSFVENGSVEQIVEIASLCRDTVDMFVQDQADMAPNDPLLEKRILEHRLMQHELERQRDDLSALKSFFRLQSDVAELRTKWRNPQQSNIGQPVSIA